MGRPPQEKPVGKDYNMTRDEFISAVTEIYGDKYDFSMVTEQGVTYNTNVTVRCPKHGLFYVTPQHLLHGEIGCFECYKEENWKKGLMGL